MKHKHAELIKAWADGAKIQERTATMWVDILHPYWYESNTYRIKPEKKKILFRNYLWRGDNNIVYVSVVKHGDNIVRPREDSKEFIRWIGDWKEVVVVPTP